MAESDEKQTVTPLDYAVPESKVGFLRIALGLICLGIGVLCFCVGLLVIWIGFDLGKDPYTGLGFIFVGILLFGVWALLKPAKSNR